MRALYVDTGAWVALIDAADPLHARAKSLFESHKSYSYISNDLVLAETVTLLRRELGPDHAVKFGAEFLDGKIGALIHSEMGDWRDALKFIKKYREQKISVADGTSVSIVRRLKIEKVASFDKHFKIMLPDLEVLGAS